MVSQQLYILEFIKSQHSSVGTVAAKLSVLGSVHQAVVEVTVFKTQG